MKKIISAIFLMGALSASYAQTTATNWTATDCSSVSHTLFTELDAGKIVVFTWVMPCASCKNGAKAAYDAVQSFATSHPGKVLCYLADDLGDADCATLSSWVTSNSVGATSNMTIFSNSGNVIKESDFGGTGMPHVIVMGGTGHQVFYNQKNSATNDLSGITAAVNSALTALNAGKETQLPVFTIAPNPVRDNLVISGDKAIAKVVISSLAGKTVKEESYANGKTGLQVGVSNLAAGTYMIRITDINGNTGTQKFVKL